MNAAVTLLHLVRHGQSTWNAEGRVQGATPHPPLTVLGREQSEAAARLLAGRLLAGRGAARLVTSDLVRARQTAGVLESALGLTAEVDAGLREQSLGAMEGRLGTELEAEPTPPGRHVTEVRWGGGESVVDVHGRVGAVLHRLLADGRDVVVVSHGITLDVARAWLSGRRPQDVVWSSPSNGSVTTVEAPVDGAGPAVRGYGRS